MVFQMADLRVSKSEVFPRKFMVAQHNAAQHRMCRQVVLCVKGAAVHLPPGLSNICIQSKWLARGEYEPPRFLLLLARQLEDGRVYDR